MIIAASGDGILISDKERSGYMKPYVEKIETEAMYAEKSWGTYLSGPQSQQNPHPNKQPLHTSKVSGGPRFFRCNHPESETSGCCAGKAESQSTNQHSPLMSR